MCWSRSNCLEVLFLEIWRVPPWCVNADGRRGEESGGSGGLLSMGGWREPTAVTSLSGALSVGDTTRWVTEAHLSWVRQRLRRPLTGSVKKAGDRLEPGTLGWTLPPPWWRQRRHSWQCDLVKSAQDTEESPAQPSAVGKGRENTRRDSEERDRSLMTKIRSHIFILKTLWLELDQHMLMRWAVGGVCFKDDSVYPLLTPTSSTAWVQFSPQRWINCCLSEPTGSLCDIFNVPAEHRGHARLVLVLVETGSLINTVPSLFDFYHDLLFKYMICKLYKDFAYCKTLWRWMKVKTK